LKVESVPIDSILPRRGVEESRGSFQMSQIMLATTATKTVGEKGSKIRDVGGEGQRVERAQGGR
jgi:hypothetical protein